MRRPSRDFRNTPCSALAAHRYARVVSAAPRGSGIRLVIHPTRLRCGGADDGAYQPSSAPVQAVIVAAAARVTVLASTSAGIGTRRITVAELPAWLRADHWGRIFQLTGPADGLTGLEGRYHP